MKPLFPISPPLEIVEEPPVALEFIALGAGCMVGFMGWVVHRAYFVTWYWSGVAAIPSGVSLPRQFDAVYAFINVCFALNQAVAVGLVVGVISRWHPYRLAVLAMLLTIFLKGFHDAFDIWNNARRPYEVAWAGWVLLLIYGLGPLLGACGGQCIQSIFVHGEIKRWRKRKP